MKRFSNILFVAWPDADDSAAFNQALTMANNNQAQITLVGLVDAPETHRLSAHAAANKLLNAMVEQRRKQLHALVQGASVTDSQIEVKVRIGKGFIEIIREVLQHKRDLVIKCAESVEGIGRRLFGSADMKLMRKCPCPVWVIKSTQQKGYKEILAAVDCDPDESQDGTLNRQILEMASSLALSEFAELHVVHAWRLPYESFLRSPHSGTSKVEVDVMLQKEEETRRSWLEALVNAYCGAQGRDAVNYLKPQLHLVNGDASSVVPALTDDIGAELVVMGTVGRAGIPGLLIGNTAENILNQINCSVLTVKPAGFVSPVTLAE